MSIKNLIAKLKASKPTPPSTGAMSFDEHVGLRGEVSLHAWNVNTGQTVLRHTGHNLLMYNERDILIELLGNILLGATDYAQGLGISPDGNRRWLKWFAVGDDNTATARTQVALGGELLKLEIASYGASTKNANALQITISIPGTDGGGDVDTFLNGQTITEVGLFTIASDEDAPGVPGPTGNEVMFSRQVHPAVVKDTAIQLDYTYNIYFT